MYRNTDPRTILRNLGLSTSACEIYLYIMKERRIEVQELQNFFRFSSVNAENNLKCLEEKGMIIREVDEKQKEYVVPLNPLIVSRSLYSRFLWEYIPTERLSAKLTLNEVRILSNYHETCDLFSKIFTPMYGFSTRSIERISGLERIPSERLSNVLSQMLSSASDEILGITAFPWTPNIALVWETLKERMASGVKYRRIADEITLIAFGHSINYRDVFEVGVNLGIIDGKEITEKFYVVDNEEVFMFFPGVLPYYFKLEGMRITIGSVVRMYRDTFEHLWSKAIPAPKIINYISAIKGEFLNKSTKNLSQEEKRVVEGLFEYGKFYKLSYTSLSLQHITSVLKPLEKKNYLILFSDSEIGFIPNLLPYIRKYTKGGKEND